MASQNPLPQVPLSRTSSFTSDPDRDSDFEDEGFMDQSQSIQDFTEDDVSVLREAEEVEGLLAKEGPLDRFKGFFGHPQPGDTGVDRQQHSDQGPNGSRMTVWDADEGEKFGDSESVSGSESLLVYEPAQQHRKAPWRNRLLMGGLILTLEILFFFSVFLWGFPDKMMGPVLSNGTHTFAATTILISLDGFRADFLSRGLTPALSSLVASGVSPKYMLPSFPSVTFPNHFTLVTGLYPESHGLVGNTFWDPELKEEFYYTDPLRSLQPKWWDAEPLWVTAEKQGIRTAIHMWPGSEAHIPPLEPTYLDKYNGTEALNKKANRVLELLDLPGDLDVSNQQSADRRPQLIAAYVPNIDVDGHEFGPNATEIRTTISNVDEMVANLMSGLSERNLTDIVNLVIVSDHGMATTSNTRLIQLDDLIDISLVDHIDGWPLRGLRPKNLSTDLPILKEKLLREAERLQGFDVYTLETMPERYHFSKNPRIAPLWVVPKTGWAIVERTDFDVAKAEAEGTVYHPKGLHGYDHEHPLMRAIFVARGPAFPHPPNSRVAVFQNIEVYNIICDSLGIEPQPGNGTLRLPLETVGLLGDDGQGIEIPPDPPEEIAGAHRTTASQGPTSGSMGYIQSPNGPPSSHEPTHQPSPVDNIEAAPHPSARPEGGSHSPTGADRTDEEKAATDSGSGDEQSKSDEKQNKGSWWDTLRKTFNGTKEWINNIIEKLKGEDKGD